MLERFKEIVTQDHSENLNVAAAFFGTASIIETKMQAFTEPTFRCLREVLTEGPFLFPISPDDALKAQQILSDPNLLRTSSLALSTVMLGVGIITLGAKYLIDKYILRQSFE